MSKETSTLTQEDRIELSQFSDAAIFAECSLREERQKEKLIANQANEIRVHDPEWFEWSRTSVELVALNVVRFYRHKDRGCQKSEVIKVGDWANGDVKKVHRFLRTYFPDLPIVHAYQFWNYL